MQVTTVKWLLATVSNKTSTNPMCSLLSMGHGHCSNVIFNSLLDSSGAHIYSSSYFLWHFLSASSTNKYIRCVTCNNEDIFQFHFLVLPSKYNLMHFFIRDYPEHTTLRDNKIFFSQQLYRNNLLAMKLWITETTATRDAERESKKKSTLFAITIFPTILLKLLLTSL